MPAMTLPAPNQTLLFAGGLFTGGNFSQEMYQVSWNDSDVYDWTWLSTTIPSRRSDTSSTTWGDTAWLFGGQGLDVSDGAAGKSSFCGASLSALGALDSLSDAQLYCRAC